MYRTGKYNQAHGSFQNHLTLTFLLYRFEYLFNFDNTFEIHDDIEVLKRMGMSFGLEAGKCSAEDLRTAKLLVPKALESYVTGKLNEAFKYYP